MAGGSIENASSRQRGSRLFSKTASAASWFAQSRKNSRVQPDCVPTARRVRSAPRRTRRVRASERFLLILNMGFPRHDTTLIRFFGLGANKHETAPGRLGISTIGPARWVQRDRARESSSPGPGLDRLVVVSPDVSGVGVVSVEPKRPSASVKNIAARTDWVELASRTVRKS